MLHLLLTWLSCDRASSGDRCVQQQIAEPLQVCHWCFWLVHIFHSRIPSKIIARSLLGLGSVSIKSGFWAVGKGAEPSLSPLSLAVGMLPQLKIMLCLPVVHCTNTVCDSYCANIKSHGNSKTFKVISNCRFDCDIYLICHPFCKVAMSAFWSSYVEILSVI